jgi:hypothetical protein
MEKYLSDLRTNAWRTGGARYNAGRRLKRRDLWAVISLSFFSALTVALAFIQKIYVTQPGTSLDNYLTALSACLGVFLLAISLIEWGAAAGAKADTLHRNAEELNKFQNKVALKLAQLKSNTIVEWAEVEGLFNEYELIKERCPYNHEPIDDLAFQVEHRLSPEFSKRPTENPIHQQSTALSTNLTPKIGQFDAFCIKIKYWLSSILYFSLFWIVILILAVLTFYINK